jgi:hypothetical protein
MVATWLLFLRISAFCFHPDRGANDFTPSKFGYEAGRVYKRKNTPYKTQPII